MSDSLTQTRPFLYIYLKRGNLLKNSCSRIAYFVTNSLPEVCVFPRRQVTRNSKFNWKNYLVATVRLLRTQALYLGICI